MWKRDKLISDTVFGESWHSYQKIVKAEKTKHFSKIISLNGHNPRVLFNTLKPVFNVPQIQCLENPSKMCEEFL